MSTDPKNASVDNATSSNFLRGLIEADLASGNYDATLKLNPNHNLAKEMKAVLMGK